MRIRQIALVAADLEPALDALCDVFAIEVAFRDPGVATFGLENGVMPVGDTFLEVVSPKQEGTTAGRFLERRGGDGGYMVILQTDDLREDRERLDGLGVRVVWEVALDDIATIHLHPRDVGGAILSLDEARPPESWRWAGPDWMAHRRTDRCRSISGVEIQARDPEAMARRWAEILAVPSPETLGAARALRLEPGTLRFVPAGDGRGEGVSAVSLECSDREAVRAAARERGLPVGPDWVQVAGTRFDLA